jgi:Fe-S-cluster containining protein
LIDELLDRYIEQGRGCGCPGDDFVDDQARYLLGVHRALELEERLRLAGQIEQALRKAAEAQGAELPVVEPGRTGVLAAFAVAGLVLGLPPAEAFVQGLAPQAQAELRHRAQALGAVWRAAEREAGNGPAVAQLVREAFRSEGRSLLLSHCPPQALAEAWDLDPSPEARTMLLHLLGDRSEQERRQAQGFLARVAGELAEALPGPGRGLWSRMSGWTRRGPRNDRLYLELMRCLPCLTQAELRRDVLARCAGHPAPAVSRRAVRQLFLEAEASEHPELYRPALQALARSKRAEVREETAFALTLLRPEPAAERLQRLWAEVVPARRRSWLSWLRERRLRRIYHLEPVALPELERTMEPGLAPDCAACPDRCCRGPASRVSLRLADLLRLKAAGLEAGIEIHKRPFTPEEIARAPHLERLEQDRAYAWFPTLRQKEDGHCVYYGQDGRCTIYEHRPLLCRSFPVQLDLERRKLSYSERCPSRKLDPEAAESLAEAVVENFNHKLRDLLLVHYARPELAELGLLPYLSLAHDPPE